MHVSNSVISGRLRLHLANWEVITQDQWVLHAVQGYKIDFVHTPRQPNPPIIPQFSKEELAQVKQAVTELTAKGAIQVVAPERSQFVSTLFLVPKKDGQQRPVINLKRLNAFVHTEHFKMEGIHTLQGLLKRGDWMAKIDLQDAYFMVPIHGEHRGYLAFCLEGITYHFSCLPFDLSSAPWVFTKTL